MIVRADTKRPVHFGWPPACGHGGPRAVCADTREETTCKGCRTALGLEGGIPPTLPTSSTLAAPPTTDRECVGQALARWRLANGLRQEQAGARIGASRQAIRHRESGFVDLSVRDLLTLCDSADEAAALVRDAWETNTTRLDTLRRPS